MLEGQVAVLSSGIYFSEKALELLNALRSSSLLQARSVQLYALPNDRAPVL